MAPSCPPPVRAVGSRITATRVTVGASSLSSSSHLALIPNSNCVKPLALPSGRPRLATRPAPTGSVALTNTIGTLRLTCCSAAVIVAPPGENYIGLVSHQLKYDRAKSIGLGGSRPVVNQIGRAH